MGEYATRKSDGAEVKIGTCEDMYYLRADQRRAVRALKPGNVDPNDPRDVLALRFRFPWPDEDHVQPGEFEPYNRAVAIPGAVAPADADHGTVQFVAHAGYVVSLPCPESLPGLKLWPPHGPQIHRNGFRGAVLLQTQKLLADGRLVPVCSCGGCGAMWRVENPADIAALAVALRSEADRREQLGQRNGTGAADRRFWDEIADRILQDAKMADRLHVVA